MRERMTDERLIEIEYVENEDTRLELHAALKVEREYVNELSERLARISALSDQLGRTFESIRKKLG
jgi:hypothetical protein